jgi:hypothetical protein
MWKTMQVYYYDENRHGLIADAIRPMVEQLQRQGAMDCFWFESHWKRGPHLNLHFDTDESRFTDLILPHVREVVGDYLRQHPSTLVVNEQEADRLHRELAKEEFESGPFTPFYPDNSVQVSDYTVRPEFWGGQESADLAVAFRVDTVRTVFDLVDHIRGDYHRRLETVMGLMIATVGAHGRLKGRHMCYRSHYEGFLAYQDPDGQIRAAMKEWYTENEAWLARTLRKWFDMAGGKKRPSLAMARWMETVRDHYARFQAAAESGHARLYDLDDIRENVKEFRPDEAITVTASPSIYHRFMDELPSATWEPAAFDAFRYSVNSTYNWFPVLGLTPLERYFLCYAIAQYAETYYQKSWWEIALNGGAMPAGFTAEVLTHA